MKPTIDRTTCSVPFLCDGPKCPRSLMPAIHATEKSPAPCFRVKNPPGNADLYDGHLYCSEACARGKPKETLKGLITCPNCTHRWKPERRRNAPRRKS